jgi:hypothetical protein
MSETIEIHLDDAREVMYEELVEEFGKGMIHAECDQHIANVLTDLYDKQDQLNKEQNQNSL